MSEHWLTAFPDRVFVTGTDTEVGKTIATLGLTRALQNYGYRVQCFKPVAAGSDCKPAYQGRNLNEDAFLLQQYASQLLPYERVNPFLLPQPIAPHIAARQAQRFISVASCVAALEEAIGNVAASGAQDQQQPREICLIEGAGGWRVPLNDREDFSDLACGLDAAVVLVVGIRLGCLNHAILTLESIQRDGLKVVGWIANHLQAAGDAQQSQVDQENVKTLKQRISAPLLAQIPYQAGLEALFEIGTERADSQLNSLAASFIGCCVRNKAC